MKDYCRILIIDDEFIMRQGLKHMMNWEAAGFQIVGEAADGEEGLAMAGTLRPHIILCDIVMPKMDGMDFVNILRKLHPEIKIVILSGYDNFEYVKNTLLSGAADYVLKPTLNPEKLLAVLQKTAENIPGFQIQKDTGFHYGRTLKRWLLGFASELEAEPFRKLFPEDCFRIFALNFRQESREGNDLSSAVYDYVKRYWENQTEFPNIMFTMQENYLCGIVNYGANEGMILQKLLNRMGEKATMICREFFCVVSWECSRLWELKEIYQGGLLREADQAFYFRDVHIRFLKKEKTAAQELRFDFHRFSNFINGKRFLDGLDMLETYCEDSLKLNLDAEKLKNQVKNVLYNFLDTFSNGQKPEIEQMRHGIFKKVDNAVYEQEFREAFREIVENLREVVNRDGGTEDERVRRILGFIDQNYEKDLDLAEIAEVFNFNYNYLSSYFNQHMTEGFSGYLNRIRIEHACRLLDENQLSISRISSQVGYSDPSYFSRVFKKLTGETPSSWRHRKGRKGNEI